MSLCASGTPCSAPRCRPFAERRVGGVGRRQRLLRLDRHEGIEARLPLRDPIETGLRRLARRQPLPARSPARPTSATSRPARCSSGGLSRRRRPARRRNVAGSRSNGSVPAIGRKAFERRADANWRCARRPRHSTGTPATSAIALISLGVGLVMRDLLRSRAGLRRYFVNSAKAPFQSSGGGFF